jgi:hypothetical protein
LQEETFAATICNLPIIAFCNLFSIYYLEIMSVTKLKTDKLKSDRTIGNWVNISISGFYALIILTMSAIQLGSNMRNKSNQVISIEVYFLKDWFSFPHPWSPN